MFSGRVAANASSPDEAVSSGRSSTARAVATARRSRVDHSPVVHPVEAVEGEVDHQRRGLRRRLVGESAERGHQPPVRVVAAAEQLLDPGAGTDQPDARHRAVVGSELDRLEQRPAGGFELSGCPLGLGQGHQQ
jgi:hypothetical protein